MKTTLKYQIEHTACSKQSSPIIFKIFKWFCYNNYQRRSHLFFAFPPPTKAAMSFLKMWPSVFLPFLLENSSLRLVKQSIGIQCHVHSSLKFLLMIKCILCCNISHNSQILEIADKISEDT
jgi:hypothetical protein